MSSTNRGADRNKFDYYVTPKTEIHKFLSEFLKNHKEIKYFNILDPCAGGDIKNAASYPDVINDSLTKCDITTLDIREDSRAQYKGVDYLTVDVKDYCKRRPNIIITNPPFYLAEDFIKKALEDVEKDGYVITLLRLNFLGSQARNKWLLNNMPYEIYVHAKRMSFTADGKTDSIEYAHFVFKKGHKEMTRLYLLEY